MALRRSFTCAHCQAILATVDPRTVLRIAAGVAVSHHRKFGTMRLTCGGCGEANPYRVPRQVEVIEVSGTEREAA